VDNLARFGPTTPKRARRLADASVDPTDARNVQGIPHGQVWHTDQRAVRVK
jgi:hypothetical protein